jgi:hypothetical protein
MDATKVPGVPAITSAEIAGGTFEHDDARAGTPGRNGGAERGVAAADHGDVVDGVSGHRSSVRLKPDTTRVSG